MGAILACQEGEPLPLPGELETSDAGPSFDLGPPTSTPVPRSDPPLTVPSRSEAGSASGTDSGTAAEPTGDSGSGSAPNSVLGGSGGADSSAPFAGAPSGGAPGGHVGSAGGGSDSDTANAPAGGAGSTSTGDGGVGATDAGGVGSSTDAGGAGSADAGTEPVLEEPFPSCAEATLTLEAMPLNEEPPDMDYLFIVYGMNLSLPNGDFTHALVARETQRDAGRPFLDSGEGDRYPIVTQLAILPQPSLAQHGSQHWLSWKQGLSLFAKPLNLAPGSTLLQQREEEPSAPALTSYAASGGAARLVAAWSEDAALWISSSELGVTWSTPQLQPFSAGTRLGTPALMDHRGELWLAQVVDETRIELLHLAEDYQVVFGCTAFASEWPLDSRLSLASDGERLSLGFAYLPSSGPDQPYGGLNVIHTRDVVSGFSGPYPMASYWDAPPGLQYFNGDLHAAYTLGTNLYIKSSIDGADWNTVQFALENEPVGSNQVPTFGVATAALAP